MLFQAPQKHPLGAAYLGKGACSFRVWAPRAKRVDVHLLNEGKDMPLERKEKGYFEGTFDGIGPGALYFFRLDGQKDRPDPASRFQPQGVHGPSEVIQPDFPWSDASWSGLPLADYIIYELHVGTFTAEGTFEAVIPFLPELRNLGITAIEIMPVAQFPGERNWGYDGVHPFAVQNSYGGPVGLKKLVDACHQAGLAVVLDVVYNHLGPEGNYLRDFAPYFTDRYRSPWGEAINFDGPESDEVRRFFIENALSWVDAFHIDALRLDAVHAILDFSAIPFLQDLAEAVHARARELHRRIFLIAESDLNDTRLIRSPERGGFGLDAQWSDDFHHALHTLLTGENIGYYEDFGRLQDLGKAFRQGFIYDGEYSPYRRRRHGNSSADIRADKFVVCSQNHDQVGNRMMGDRLSTLVSFSQLKLAAAMVLLSPHIPLLFMGEEYGEPAPFPYFIHHSDPELVEAVRHGRKEEFSSFRWKGEPPDPQAEETFQKSRLNFALRHQTPHRFLYDFYRDLIRLRRSLPALRPADPADREVMDFEKEKVIYIRCWKERDEAILLANFSLLPQEVGLPLPAGSWQKELDSEDERWGGKGSRVPQQVQSAGRVKLRLDRHGVLLYRRMKED